METMLVFFFFFLCYKWAIKKKIEWPLSELEPFFLYHRIGSISCLEKEISSRTGVSEAIVCGKSPSAAGYQPTSALPYCITYLQSSVPCTVAIQLPALSIWFCTNLQLLVRINQKLTDTIIPWFSKSSKRMSLIVLADWINDLNVKFMLFFCP